MFGDITKLFGKSFLIADLLPAALLCGATLIFIDMRWLHPGPLTHWPAFGIGKPLMIFIVLFGMAMLLALTGYWIIRLYEGYNAALLWGTGATLIVTAAVAAAWWRVTLGSAVPALTSMAIAGLACLALAGSHHLGLWWQRRAFTRLKERMEAVSDTDPSKGELTYRFTRAYPSDASRVRQTRLGNVLRSFEAYPATMFYIEPITSWYRLAAVLPDAFRTSIEEAEASTQFFINTSFVMSLIALEATYASITHPHRWGAVAVAMILSYGAYRLGCEAARNWGEFVRAAFDLYRFDLLAKLRVWPEKPQPITLQQERVLWQEIQGITFYNRPSKRLRFLPPGMERGDVREEQSSQRPE